jgi:hypothetical protein
MGDPILFYVIVFGKEPIKEEEVQCMNIGCFISQKKAGDHKSNATRLALLYRKHVQGNDAIRNALCTMLKQIYWFSARVKKCNQGNWKYLSPHCALVSAAAEENEDRKVSCRRQNSVCFAAQLDCANPFFLNHQEVYRAYDSRPWPIARSSSVYDSGLFVVTREIDEVKVVDKRAADTFEDGYRVFDFGGQLKVIAIPFIEGSHCPQNKEQLVYVAKFLKTMHDQGFVHGDIRLLNIVFTANPSDSQLIDFDFGGREDDNSLVYPPGYKRILEDGERVGIAHQRIMKWHDVKALYKAFSKVLFRAGPEWETFRFSSNSQFCIDDLITLLEVVVRCNECEIRIEHDLIDLLERNTILG